MTISKFMLDCVLDVKKTDKELSMQSNQITETKKSWMIPVLEEAGLELTKASGTVPTDGNEEVPGSN